MKFFTWTNKQNAQDSLDAINKEYGCPFVASNGYVMERWDLLTETRNKGIWGFREAGTRLGKNTEDLKAKLIGSYNELSKKPTNWTDWTENLI